MLAAAAVAALHGWAVVALTPSFPGSIGLNLNALGTDYMPLYTGARWLLAGHLAALYDGERLTAFLNSTFAGWLTEPMPYRPWVYPPTYLLAMLPFALMPFAVSYVAFEAATACLLSLALWHGAERPGGRAIIIAAALLGPAAAINFGLGQNAFLSAALLVGGFRLARSRPALAGIVLGILTLKPQNWLLVPVALAALRQWNVLAWSITAALALVLASAAAFGLDPWHHWLNLAQVGYEQSKLGAVWDDSIYACLLAGGAAPRLARALQAVGLLLAAAAAYATCRTRLPRDQKIAIVLAATVFGAPHSSLADTVLLATAAGLWAAEAAARGEASLAKWTAALAIWLAPVFNPPIVSAFGRLTPVLILAFIGVVLTGVRPADAPTVVSETRLAEGTVARGRR